MNIFVTFSFGNHVFYLWPLLGCAAPLGRRHNIENKNIDRRLGKLVLMYFDDMLVICWMPKEHIRHPKKVLNILRTQKLFCGLHDFQFNGI